MNLNDLKLTEAQKSGIAKLAIQAANDLGYCSESTAVLREMGLGDHVRETRTVTLEVEIEVDIGSDIEDYHFDIRYENYDINPDVISWEMKND